MTNTTEYSMSRDRALEIVRDCARHDRDGGKGNDRYSLTGDAVDVLRTWRREAASAGDAKVYTAIDFLGFRRAAAAYVTEYEGKRK